MTLPARLAGTLVVTLLLSACTTGAADISATPMSGAASNAEPVLFEPLAPCGTVTPADGPVDAEASREDASAPPVPVGSGPYVHCAVVPDDGARRGLVVTVLSDQPSGPFAGRTPLFFHPGGPGVSTAAALRDHPPAVDLSVHTVFTVDGDSGSARRGACGQRGVEYGTARADFGASDRNSGKRLVAAAGLVRTECGLPTELPALVLPVGAERAAFELEAVRTALGLGKLDMLTHSWGTAVAQRTVQLFPGSVRRAVLDGPFAPDASFDGRVDAVAGALTSALDSGFICGELACTPRVAEVVGPGGPLGYQRLRAAVLARRPQVGLAGPALTGPLLDAAVLLALRERASLPGLGRALDDALRGDATGIFDTGEVFSLGGDRQSFYRSLCPDVAMTESALAKAADQAAAGLLGSYLADLAPCAGTPRVATLETSAADLPEGADLPEVLVFASDSDVLTPLGLVEQDKWLSRQRVCAAGTLGHTVMQAAPRASTFAMDYLRRGPQAVGACPRF